jgi:transposase
MEDVLEEDLFMATRDLFTGLDLFFLDTTSLYFEGEGGQSLGERGHSKDHRPDLNQMVVGTLINDTGRPVCCEMWPGNTADVKILVPVAERLLHRFSVSSFCLVADRGMISQETMEELEQRNLHYILGARMRRVKVIKEEVLARAGRYHYFHIFEHSLCFISKRVLGNFNKHQFISGAVR